MITRRKLTTVAFVGLVGLSTTGCTLFEDGSIRTADGIGACLFPEMGCHQSATSAPAPTTTVVLAAPPTLPPVLIPELIAETIPDIGYGPCAEAPLYAFGVTFEFIPHYDGPQGPGMGTCVVMGTAEQLDILSESAFCDE